MEWLRRNIVAVAAVAAGGAVMLVLGYVTGGGTGVVWAGAITGVALGVAIAATSSRRE